MYRRFGLVLMVNHDCNLHCTYCYTGSKFDRSLPEAFGRKAIDRALASLGSRGTLELGFFGGEPLLEPRLIQALLEYARGRSQAAGVELSVNLTTNGTVTTPSAWSLMADPRVQLALSHDGLARVHDRHRRFAGGGGSSATVLATMDRLLEAGKDIRVVMVVRPDTVEKFPEGLRFLRERGVRYLEPSLDLWTTWTGEDVAQLTSAISRAARVWGDGLPHSSVSWFDEKAALIARVPVLPTAKCSFGAGEVAIAPSGHLYPCERLIAEDSPANPARLPGHVLCGDDFLALTPAPCRSHAACAECSIAAFCNTHCRCSNYVRTGDVATPDGLLCRFNRAVVEETARVLEELSRPTAGRVARTLTGAVRQVEAQELAVR